MINNYYTNTKTAEKKQLSFFGKGFKAMIVALLLFAASGPLSAQVTLTVAQGTNAASVQTGNEFVDTIYYQCTSLTSSGQNMVTYLKLPANLVPFTTSPLSVNYNSSQVASVAYNAADSMITVTYVNPLPGGSSGYLTIGFTYLNGTTPNGYKPNIVASINATNFVNGSGAALGPIYDTVAVAAIAANNYYVKKTIVAGGAINDSTIYKLSIGQNNGGIGSLNLIDPVFVDTLPAGATFVAATAFSGSYTPVYNAAKNTVTWSWGTKGVDTSFSGYNSSAYITVTYNTPTFSVNQNVCNHATLSGSVVKLPIGTDSTVSASGSVCETLIVPNAKVECTGGDVVAATYPWFVDNYVLSGTSSNTFVNGWKNEGNTSLNEVDLTYTIDNNVDMSTININPVLDVFDSVTAATIQVSYATNLNPTFSSPVTYQSLSIPNGTTWKPSLGTGEYLTQVKFKVTGNLPLGSSEDLTYYGNVRTAIEGSKNGSTITEGSYGDGDKGTPPATIIYNKSTGDFIYGTDTIAYSGCNNSAEIIFAQPAFHDSYKSITNGSSFDASDTVNYQFHTYLGGNRNATSVVVSDTLDARLLYVGGSTYTVGSGTPTSITPDTTRSASGLLILTYNLGTLTPGSDYYINFNAEIIPGTLPGTVWNKFKLNSSNALFNQVTDSINFTILSSAAVRVYKGQTGCDHTNYVYYPNIAAAQSGGPVDYKITVKNLGNTTANDLVLVDVFPFIGDFRGSQWYANMASPALVSNPNYTVYYTTVSNPCFSDFSPAPAFFSSCNTPSWSTTLPTDITTVTAIKLANFTTPIGVLDSVVLSWPMVAPVGVPQPPSGANLLMNNSVTYQVTTNGTRLLPSTPNEVGMNTSCTPINGSIGNYVWIDSNRNGLQDEPANLGLNGVKVYLYQNTGSGFVKVDSTITANDWAGNPGYYLFVDLLSGQYYVQFPTSYNGDSLTKAVTQTAEVDGNSDANVTTGNSEIVTINTASSNPQDVNNTTIDAGYVPYGSLGNYVWYDKNANGLQDDGASSGINGLKVYLYELTKSGYKVVDSTVTADSAGLSSYPGYYNFVIDSSGLYKVLFPTKVSTKILTTQDTTLDKDSNSDAYIATGFSELVVMNNFVTPGYNKTNPTIDAGYVCSVQKPVLTLAGSPQLCDGTFGVFTASDTTYNPSYTWYKAGSLVNGSTTDTLHTSVANSSTSPAGAYWVTTTDTGGCTSQNSDTITITTVASITGVSSVCMGSTIALSDATSGGTWASSNTTVATISSTGVVTPVSAGTSTISYVVTNVTNNCSTTKTTVITVDTVPVVKPIVATATAVCAGGTTGTTTTLTDGTTGGTWSSSNTADATVNSSGVVTGIKAGSVNINYAVRNSYNCTTTVSTPITINPLPTVASITGTTTVCKGSVTTLADVTTGGVWSTANNTYATVDAAGDVSGVAKGLEVVSYTVTNTNNCTTIKTATVTINDVPTVAAITGTATVCANSTTTLADATTGGAWSTSDNTIATVSSTGVVTGIAAGTATISYAVTNTCGTTTVTKQVTVYALPTVASITGNATVCANSTTSMADATTGGVWSSSNTSVATVSSTGVVTGVKAGSATISYTVTNANNCVTAVTQSVIVNATSTSTTTASICSNGSYTFNGTAYSAAGTYVAHLTNSVGCDSAATLVLTVKPTSTSTTTKSICSGGSYTFNGTTYSTTGTYVAHLTNSVGCDSAATLVLTVKPTSSSTTYDTMCAGSSYTFNGTTYSAAGTYVAHLTNSVGCDSAATLVLTVKPTSTSTTAASMCAGSSYTFNGTTYSAAGTYVAHLTNSVGCDSSATLVLTVLPTSTSTTYDTMCAGGSYTFNGLTYTLPGTYVAHLTNSVGCDSAATLVLVVNQPTTSTTTASMCAGSSYIFNGTTYDSAGTYVIHLTNHAGCDSAATLILSVPTLRAAFAYTDSTIANTPCLSNNSFSFSDSSIGATSYQWFTNDSLVSTTSKTADTTFAAANTYYVTLVVANNLGCTDTTTDTIYVYSCSVSSGSTGGLESKSLGAAIGTRNFGLYKSGTNGPVHYTASQLIAAPKRGSYGTMGTGGSGTSLAALMPYRVNPAYQQYDQSASVTDLESMTNAIDVRAVDFTLNQTTKAVAFATETLGGVYSHTKPICDRLRGSELLNVGLVQIQNMSFVRYTLRQPDGSTEYAISFSAGKKAGRNTYSIQSNWMTQDYIGEDTLVNYQLWAASPADVTTMVMEALSRLQAIMPLVQVTNVNDLPTAYVTKGNRNGTTLSLTINNTTNYTSGYLELTQNQTEVSTSSSVNVVPFTIAANGKTSIEIPVSDTYDATIKMYLNSNLEDLVYMADGIWGNSYDSATTSINQFTVQNDANRQYNPAEYPLLRDAQITATTSNYVTIYKFLKGGAVAEDLSAYKSFKFTAGINSVGQNLRITLTKQSISGWNSQYTYLITSVQDGKAYQIDLSDFKSADSTLSPVIDASDITSVVFNVEIPSGQSTSFTAGISNASFSTLDIDYENSLQVKTVSISPNPNNGNFTVSFESPSNAQLQLNVVDLTGRIITTKTINTIKGKNEQLVQLNMGLTNNLYLVTLVGADVKYDTQKIIIKNK